MSFQNLRDDDSDDDDDDDDPSSLTVALEFTQPLTEMSTRKSFWEVNRGWRARLTTSSLSVSRLSR
jgi:hypothetical protein